MNQQSPSIPKEVEAHYLETKESERLSGAHVELGTIAKACQEWPNFGASGYLVGEGANSRPPQWK